MILSVHGLNRGTVSLGLFQVAVDVVRFLLADVGALTHADHDVVLFLGVDRKRVKSVSLDKTIDIVTNKYLRLN